MTTRPKTYFSEYRSSSAPILLMMMRAWPSSASSTPWTIGGMNALSSGWQNSRYATAPPGGRIQRDRPPERTAQMAASRRPAHSEQLAFSADPQADLLVCRRLAQLPCCCRQPEDPRGPLSIRQAKRRARRFPGHSQSGHRFQGQSVHRGGSAREPSPEICAQRDLDAADDTVAAGAESTRSADLSEPGRARRSALRVAVTTSTLHRSQGRVRDAIHG